MGKSRQQKFSFFQKVNRSFGGSSLKGKRKSQRPISIKLPLHLILKCEGMKVFDPNNKRLRSLIYLLSRKYNIRLFEFAINWTHIHFGIQVKCRCDYNRFIRDITSKLAMAIRQARPGIKKVFEFRPFTRIVTHGPDFENLIEYLLLNQQEAMGLVMRAKKGKRSQAKAKASS